MVSHSCSGPQKPGPTKGGSLTPFRGYTHMGPPRGGLTRLPGAIIYRGRREVVPHTCPGLIYTGGRREVVPHTCPGLIYTGGRREVVPHTCPGLIYTGGRREVVPHTCPGLLYSTRSIYIPTYTYTHRWATTTMATQNKKGGIEPPTHTPNTRTSETTRSMNRPQQSGDHPHEHEHRGSKIRLHPPFTTVYQRMVGCPPNTHAFTYTPYDTWPIQILPQKLRMSTRGS